MTKVLYGLRDRKIAVVDVNTTIRAQQQCFKEKCTSVIVANKTDELMDAFVNGADVTIHMFKGVEL